MKGVITIDIKEGHEKDVYETKLHKRKRERGKRTESGRSV